MRHHKPVQPTTEDTVKYFESLDEEQVTVRGLVDHMEMLLEDTDHQAYSVRHMKDKLVEHYGSEIGFFFSQSGNVLIIMLV